MPRISATETTDEEIEEWLGRLEEKSPLPENYDDFVRILRGEIEAATGVTYDFNDTQIQLLWDAKGSEVVYSEHGIHGVIIHYPWGVEIRYGIKGKAGLWGWESVQEFGREEGWLE